LPGGSQSRDALSAVKKYRLHRLRQMRVISLSGVKKRPRLEPCLPGAFDPECARRVPKSRSAKRPRQLPRGCSGEGLWSQRFRSNPDSLCASRPANYYLRHLKPMPTRNWCRCRRSYGEDRVVRGDARVGRAWRRCTGICCKSNFGLDLDHACEWRTSRPGSPPSAHASSASSPEPRKGRHGPSLPGLARRSVGLAGDCYAQSGRTESEFRHHAAETRSLAG